MPKISKIICSNKSSLNPIIVNFQNGKTAINTKFEAGIYKSTRSKLVAVKNEKMLYMGKVNNDDLFNHFLVVHNKRKNKLRLIQVGMATVSAHLNKKGDLLNVSTAVSQFKTSMANLNKQFGSKKTKRYTEQKERLNLNIDSVKDELEKTVANIEINENDFGTAMNQNKENDSLYRPPINRSASTPNQVYQLHDLIPISVLDSLRTTAESILNNSLKIEFCDFIQNCFNKLTTVQNQKQKILACSILIYVNYLIKFVTIPTIKLTKNFIICPQSKEANSHILDSFSVVSKTTRQRPIAMKDKALCYVLILSLIAMEMNVSGLDQLAKDIKIGVKKITNVARVLAITTSKDGFCLKLPLPPPVSLVRSPKKKK